MCVSLAKLRIFRILITNRFCLNMLIDKPSLEFSSDAKHLLGIILEIRGLRKALEQVSWTTAVYCLTV